jgi:N-acetylglucosaminyldiphosphoundecaprenol N-acetyl-beta-D-mannosaminyltransferase
LPPEGGSLSGEPRRTCGGPRSLRILGSRIDPVSSRRALDQIRTFLDSASVHHVITGNTLMVLAAEKDRVLRDILEQAALVLPESWGIRWASRVHGNALAEFTPGIDLMLEICRLAEAGGHPIYLLGSAPGVAEEAGQALSLRFPGLKIVGVSHGFFSSPHPNPLPKGEGGVARVRQNHSESEVVQFIRQAKPSILFVGMGMPAQEKWIAAHLKEMGVPVVMGVGGSFDVLSGRLKRAPAWVRRLGIEWSYRLLQEPWRWRRILQLPVFAWKVMKEQRKLGM